jgi:peptidoglycan/LPS O-acetylase OafA/YrhL
MLYVGMRYLNFANQWLVYGRETILPFYLLHQPVIIAIAFFVVQWDAELTRKILVVVLGSFLVTLGLVELIVKRINVLRGLFGMKTRRRAMSQQKRDRDSCFPRDAPTVGRELPSRPCEIRCSRSRSQSSRNVRP